MINLFDNVRFIDEDDHKFFGNMKVIRIYNSDEADFYGSYPIICRSELVPEEIDCRDFELELLEQ